jgi:hypothetical protein
MDVDQSSTIIAYTNYILDNSTSGFMYQRNGSRGSHRYLNDNGHSSILHHSQKVEITQISVNG